MVMAELTLPCCAVQLSKDSVSVDGLMMSRSTLAKKKSMVLGECFDVT